jgi:ubiquinone/menaquinone biosynthesis C-methylase UbiE
MTELLDTDSGTPAEVANSFVDLRWFNRWFGGISTCRAMIESVMRKTGRTEFSMLEVAAGDGFVPRTLQSELERDGVRLEVTLLDRVPTHLPKNGSTRKIVGDALNLPFPDSAFDFVSSSLFVHHLPPDEAECFARETLRVSRTAVLVHDLIRHPLHLAIAYAGVPLYRSRITRNDAPASIWQAYTVNEMCDFFHQAGAANVEVQKHFLFRMGVVAWK